MLSLRNTVTTSCRFLSTKKNSAATSISVTKSSPTTAVESAKKLRNNQMGETDDGGQKYYGFTYYPRFIISLIQEKINHITSILTCYRFPGQEEAPHEPSRALMVQRLYTLKHRPYWEKDVFTKIGLPDTVKVRNSSIMDSYNNNRDIKRILSFQTAFTSCHCCQHSLHVCYAVEGQALDQSHTNYITSGKFTIK